MLDGRSVPGNLPAELSTLIGRDDALTDVDAAVRAERLVVLTGAGRGQDALALQALWAAGFRKGVDRRPDARQTRARLRRWSGALGFVPCDGLTPHESVIEGVSDRHMLLVLDNCEHMLDAVAGFVVDLLRRCARGDHRHEPGTLGVQGEQVIVVPRSPSTPTPSTCSSIGCPRRPLVRSR